jgi:magnesium transporter
LRKIKYKKGRKIQPSILEYTGIHSDTVTELQLFVYNQDDITEYHQIDVGAIEMQVDLNKVNWVNIHGLNDANIIQYIGTSFGADNFIIGDILNTTKRTKLEEYSDILFFNVKSLLPMEGSDNISVEQISFLLKDHVLLSFQEKRSDFFIHIRERIRTNSGIVRSKKADFLLYLLLDAIIENFYITLESEEDKVDNLINLIKINTKPETLEHLEKQVCLIENSLNEHINKVKHIEYIYIRNISDMNVLNNEYNELKKIIISDNFRETRLEMSKFDSLFLFRKKYISKWVITV